MVDRSGRTAPHPGRPCLGPGGYPRDQSVRKERCGMREKSGEHALVTDSRESYLNGKVVLKNPIETQIGPRYVYNVGPVTVVCDNPNSGEEITLKPELLNKITDNKIKLPFQNEKTEDKKEGTNTILLNILHIYINHTSQF